MNRVALRIITNLLIKTNPLFLLLPAEAHMTLFSSFAGAELCGEEKLEQNAEIGGLERTISPDNTLTQILRGADNGNATLKPSGVTTLIVS